MQNKERGENIMAADREGQESSNIRITSWYPGHMKKTRELIENNLKMVDLVIEVVDARIPVSSRNPLIAVSYTHLDVYKRQT